MLATLLLLALGLVAQVPAPAAGDAIPGEVLVKLRAGADVAALSLLPGEAAAPALPAPRGHDLVGLERILRLRCPAGSEPELLARLLADPAVEWAEHNRGGPALLGAPLLGAPLPDDPFLDFQWHVHQDSDIDMDLPEAWELRGGFEADPLLVAVIDAGFPLDIALPDLSGMLWDNPGELLNGQDDDGNGFVDDQHGYDFVVGEADPDGGHPHGVWVSAILAARTDNGAGIAGVAPGVRLMHLRAFDDTGDFPALGPYPGKLSAAAAVVYAVDEGARLINNSWGDNTGPTQVILDAVQYAADNGALMVMASGNGGAPIGWPSQIDAAFAVAGLAPDGSKWSGSNFGAWVDISAAAAQVPLLDPSGLLFLGDGTSAAAPAVTGTVALLLSEDASLPMLDQRRVVQLGAVSVDALNPGFVGQLGAGFVNTEDALRQLLPAVALGSSLPGSTAPTLHAYGGSAKGKTFAFSISGGPPAAPAALVVGFSVLNAPAFGGVLVPNLNLLHFVTLDGNGRWHVEFPLPLNLPANTPVAWLQGLVKDAGAPAGIAMTGAVRLEGP